MRMNLAEALQVALQHQVAGRDDTAASVYSQILQAVPDNYDALHQFALLLHRRGRQREALALAGRALSVRKTAAAYTNLGAVLLALGRNAEAVTAYRAALVQAPGHAETKLKLANLLLFLDQPDEAEHLFRELIAQVPGHPEATALLGTTWLNRGRYAEAEPLLRQVVERYPDEPYMPVNLAMTLFYLGRQDESHRLLRRALSRTPDTVTRHSPPLFSMSCDDRFSPDEYLAAVRRFGVQARASARAYTHWQRAPGDAPAGPLRIGLVSGDLGAHPVGYFLEPLLAGADPARISFHAYASWPRNDAINARLRSHCASWRDIHGVSDEAAAALIHGDGIDILVDLAGHTPRNRLPLFAWKPAPVQVTWLGFFASTGMAEIDWILTDPVAVPAGTEAQFTERAWPLPETRLCFSPPTDAPDVASLPALARGHVTFGAFQNMAKLNDGVLALWSRVMAAVPGAHLRLQNTELAEAQSRDELLRRLAALGIAADRVTLAAYVPRAAYLAAYGEVDLLLDTFPFNGGTTTCEALWMGVPTLTLAGHSMLARQGASLLATAGLSGWVASDRDDYVRRATAFAADLPALAAQRAALRAQVHSSPLFDGARFARDFADAMHGLWRASTPAGVPPALL